MANEIRGAKSGNYLEPNEDGSVDVKHSGSIVATKNKRYRFTDSDLGKIPAGTSEIIDDIPSGEIKLINFRAISADWNFDDGIRLNMKVDGDTIFSNWNLSNRIVYDDVEESNVWFDTYDDGDRQHIYIPKRVAERTLYNLSIEVENQSDTEDLEVYIEIGWNEVENNG